MALRPRELRFLAVYLAQDNRNGAQAYREAISARGSDQNAANEASKILKRPEVALMVTRFDERVRERLTMDAENLTRLWSQVVLTDRSELSELRRVPCRYCWSPNGEPQETPGEQQARRREHDRRVAIDMAKLGVTISDPRAIEALKVAMEFNILGGTGYNRRRTINEECVECDGIGIEQIVFKDTRNLSPAARAVFEGVKQTKDGLEVKMYSRADAAAALARRFGIAGGDPKPPSPADGPKNVTGVDAVEASKVYARIMDDSD